MFTLIFIAVTAVVSLLALNNRRIADRLILWPPAIAKKHQYDRLVTHGFIHADFMHLFFNMFTLFFFGRQIEGFMLRQTGALWVFPLFYLSALVVAILPTYLKHQKDPNYMSLGASGAVSAVLFAFILLAPWSKILVFVIPMPAILFAILYVAYSIWMDRRGGDRINHSAHLAGAAYGLMFMLIMAPDVLQNFLYEMCHPTF
ncbi:rhomboid family intramembrane serine protease [Pseudoxanthomonas sp.]|uniref:rhomboid family intramembrane serine protease n=1 Tax=Pseudoxanthomonas sp. TaxID=1871049 RepID=UPI0026066BC8|nr:rhomboid family intramembrane serine protease [Pseudoxanthomonas sp.]WDS37191.1 MAG: rhomboid family intramembrane serine protease [Pseudoxanthomonas sp.]